MKKTVINNKSRLHNAAAIYKVIEVMNLGKISQSVNGSCYCTASTFTNCRVVCHKTKAGSFIFNVLDL